MSADRTLRGERLSPGRVVGRLCLRQLETSPFAPEDSNDGAAEESERFRRAAQRLCRELRQSADSLEAESMTGEADIVRAHLAMLQDSQFHRRVHDSIQEAEIAAEQAVEQVLGEMAKWMGRSEDPVMSDRSADFRDLAGQFKARLAGSGDDLHSCIGELKDPILVLPELLASTVLDGRAAGVRGFIVSKGTGLSHGAILAKSFGLPVLRVRSTEPLAGAHGKEALLDADGGCVRIEPAEAELQSAAAAEAAPAEAGPLPARLWVSLVDAAQLDTVDWTGIEGVGLYRTEALFMRRAHDFPGEAEQVRAFRRLFEAAGPRPVVIRTADLGADKPVAHMSFGPQQNPYLGLRAHRIFRFHPEILVTQVRAALRAAAGDHSLRLMFPMLETLEQWQFVRHLVDQAVQGLERDGAGFQRDFEQGVLVETPSAAWSFDRFLEVVDFASVGTNDLIQYFFAVERDTANVSDLYQPEHPSVLSVLKHLAGGAADAGVPLSICGELASEPDFAPLLVGLGIRDLSVAPPQVPVIRRRLSETSASDCEALADRCLRCGTAAEVRDQLGIVRETRVQQMPETLPEGHAVDPVCGMILHTEDADFTLYRGGRRYYFCSARCLRRFRRQAAAL